MKTTTLVLAICLGILCCVVILMDAIFQGIIALRRRRQVRSGTYGVVVDARGRVLGTYLDPFTIGKRGGAVHRGDSPWTPPGPDGETWAWEGFGATEEEARLEAERLRRRYLQLLPGLADDADEEWKQ